MALHVHVTIFTVGNELGNETEPEPVSMLLVGAVRACVWNLSGHWTYGGFTYHWTEPCYILHDICIGSRVGESGPKRERRESDIFIPVPIADWPRYARG